MASALSLSPSACPEWFMHKLYKPNNNGSLDVNTGFALGFSLVSKQSN